MSASTIHVYLAGPDVFAPDAVAIGEQKKAFLANLGLAGHYPFDNEIASDETATPQKMAQAIARANERMILNCAAMPLGIILIDLTPFRGIAMDSGTAFEAGFMAALSYSRENVVLIGYSADERTYEQRTAEDFYHGQTSRDEQNRLIAPDGSMIESFGGQENLMITAAIERTGGKIFRTFEEAARFAASVAKERGFL